jgi:proteasome lid subunit RPN8/RPN11
VTVANCFALEHNVRSHSPYKEYMDSVMAEHAIPSVTPLEKRGWVADPSELFARIKQCREHNRVLVGTYHMHRVGWEHDSKRDTPTKLDAILAKESGLVMFIISMVDPAAPIIRAFYEGVKEKEISVC